MFRRREPVPFAFIAEADRFRGNVTPPPPERPSRGERAGRSLLVLTLVAGIVGALIVGMPALSTPSAPPAGQSQAAPGH
ncbi:hypothetical protein ACIQ7S_05655 [Streptomyces griseoluteus]|uniref:hypothetical protein n=1 Tax=Streptomyces TaxID=1883 RepID=UPI0010294451|nr:hypothetical protein [Streptomyces sp. BK022]RZU44828.1 hypothetical protein EV284_2305 [Streptomyces sp. BK022]